MTLSKIKSCDTIKSNAFCCGRFFPYFCYSMCRIMDTSATRVFSSAIQALTVAVLIRMLNAAMSVRILNVDTLHLFLLSKATTACTVGCHVGVIGNIGDDPFNLNSSNALHDDPPRTRTRNTPSLASFCLSRENPFVPTAASVCGNGQSSAFPCKSYFLDRCSDSCRKAGSFVA